MWSFCAKSIFRFYAVDEAHCISEWGHDFRPEYRRIRPIINEIGKRPLIALTATATPKVQHDIQKNLGMIDASVFKSSFNRSNLYYEIRPKTANIDREIIKYIKSNEGKSGIIYCLSRKKVEEFADILKANGIKALPYHAGMDSQQRSSNQDAFLMEKADVIVATIAFGMGYRQTRTYGMSSIMIFPKRLEGYYQETGRAGRDGGEGQCIAFYAYKDLQKLEKLHAGKTLWRNRRSVSSCFWRLLLMPKLPYVDGKSCCTISVKNTWKKTCGNCDNCLEPKKRKWKQRNYKRVLEVVRYVKGKTSRQNILSTCWSATRPPKYNLTSTMNWRFSVPVRMRKRRHGMPLSVKH